MASCTSAPPDLDALDGLDAHERLGQAPVELAVPLHVAAEARHHAGGDHLEDPAQGVARVRRLVDRLLHARLGRRVGAGEVARARPRLQVGRREARQVGRLGGADGHHVREHVDAHRREELPAHGADGRARRRLPRARPLEDVAEVMPVVLEASREVGVSGARPGEGLGRLGHDAGRHPIEPVLVVAVQHRDGDGPAECLAAAHPDEELDPVGLDLHAAAAPVPALPAGEVHVDVLGQEREPRGDPLDDRGEPRAVGFPGRHEAEASHRAGT
jgi:hypothetical protein